MFQSTPPRGGRRVKLMASHRAHAVSIHAPARGATPVITTGAPSKSGFNPRPRAGGDPDASEGAADLTRFQSTPPRGGRLRERPHNQEVSKFQSTPPRGGRRASASS